VIGFTATGLAPCSDGPDADKAVDTGAWVKDLEKPVDFPKAPPSGRPSTGQDGTAAARTDEAEAKMAEQSDRRRGQRGRCLGSRADDHLMATAASVALWPQ